MTEKDYSVDTLTEEIGVLTRREVEARILIPVIDALGEKFDREKVVEAISQSIIRIAREQGKLLADVMGGNTAGHFMDSLEFWTKNNALEIKVHKQDDTALSFDVTRCRYAEMYKALGAADLGRVFSCNRDFALIEGFNPRAVLTRTQTIMEGDPVCDFRYDFSLKKE
jgi:hypothetical protein